MTRSVVGALLLGVLMLAYAEALARLRKAETGRPSRFGYARDAVNMAATLALSGAYWACAFAGPAALLAGLLTTLAIYSLDWVIALGLKLEPSRLFLMPTLVGWAIVIGALPERIRGTFDSLIARALP